MRRLGVPPVTEHDRHEYVALGGAQVLRVSLRHNFAGRPTWVALARGIGTGESWRADFSEVLTFPAELLPAVRAALEELGS